MNKRILNIAIPSSIKLLRPALPHSLLFLCSAEAKQLADDLTRGLEKAVEDGSFERTFNKYFAEFIKAADIKHRYIFELKILDQTTTEQS